MGRLVGKQRPFEWHLHGVEDARFLRRKVASEVAQERFLAQPSLIVGPENAGTGRRRWILLSQSGIILARIGGARGDIDNGRNFWVYACFGDNHAGKGVSDKYSWAFLPGQYALSCINCGLQTRERVLHGSDLHALWLKPCDDLGPARPVSKQSVHEDNIPSFWRGLRNGRTLKERTSRAGSHH